MVKDIEKQMKENGLDISQFYSMSLKIPLGSTVELKIDGKKIDVKPLQNGFNNSLVSSEENANTITESASNKVSALTSCTEEENRILDSIFSNGYVKNSRLWRRWITAQTFKMLNYRSGWDGYLRENISYKYCFLQLQNEFYVQRAMVRDKDFQEFKMRNHFFNKDVFMALIKSYIKQLNKYHKKGKVKNFDLFLERMSDFEHRLEWAETTDKCDVSELSDIAKAFVNSYYKLPLGTPLCAEWKNAYRGSGAYYSLKNLIMWHNVKIKVDDHFLNTKESLIYLDNEVKSIGNDHWKLQVLLKKVIKDNDFNLAKSIQSQK